MKPALKKTLLALGVVFAAWNIGYFAALRSWHQHWGATREESSAFLPGDAVFPSTTGQVTHAITINAPPESIWPWLMQIGQDRSGFYSYTPLENLFGCDMPKVHKLVPEWTPRTPGETVWFCNPKRYDGMGKMIAAVVEPQRAFAMVMPGDWQQIRAGKYADGAMWEFALEPMGPQQTRLIARVRGGQAKTVSGRAANLLFWEPAHFVMERKMLLTIKKLAENG